MEQKKKVDCICPYRQNGQKTKVDIDKLHDKAFRKSEKSLESTMIYPFIGFQVAFLCCLDVVSILESPDDMGICSYCPWSPDTTEKMTDFCLTIIFATYVACLYISITVLDIPKTLAEIDKRSKFGYWTFCVLMALTETLVILKLCLYYCKIFSTLMKDFYSQIHWRAYAQMSDGKQITKSFAEQVTALWFLIDLIIINHLFRFYKMLYHSKPSSKGKLKRIHTEQEILHV